MTDDTAFKAKVKQRLQGAIAPHMELLRPLIIEALQKPEAQREACLEVIASYHTAHMGNLLLSFNTTLCCTAAAAEASMKAQIGEIAAQIPVVMKNLRDGAYSPTVRQIDIATGAEVPFDFRDHLSPGAKDDTKGGAA